jgi:hypothetical protein
VRFLDLTIEGQQLRMAYMDVPPSDRRASAWQELFGQLLGAHDRAAVKALSKTILSCAVTGT